MEEYFFGTYRKSADNFFLISNFFLRNELENLYSILKFYKNLLTEEREIKRNHWQIVAADLSQILTNKTKL